MPALPLHYFPEYLSILHQLSVTIASGSEVVQVLVYYMWNSLGQTNVKAANL